jgi:hypothetical protein
MGEVAEMMIDGTLCEQCGEFLDGESPGYPRSCTGCDPAQEREAEIDAELARLFERQRLRLEKAKKATE